VSRLLDQPGLLEALAKKASCFAIFTCWMGACWSLSDTCLIPGTSTLRGSRATLAPKRHAVSELSPRIPIRVSLARIVKRKEAGGRYRHGYSDNRNEINQSPGTGQGPG